MAGLKESGQAVGAQVLTELAGFAPPTMLAQAARLQARQRFFNLVVTNVPGPQFPLYMLGRRLRAIYPLVPLAQNTALGIAIMSYDGQLDFGLLGDYDALPDLDELAAELERGDRRARRRGRRAGGAQRPADARAGRPRASGARRARATRRAARRHRAVVLALAGGVLVGCSWSSSARATTRRSAQRAARRSRSGRSCDARPRRARTSRAGQRGPALRADPPTSGPHVPAPVARDAPRSPTTSSSTRSSSATSCSLYGDATPAGGAARGSQRRASPARSTPRSAAAGQAVILARRPGAQRRRSRSPGARMLRVAERRRPARCARSPTAGSVAARGMIEAMTASA